MLSDKQGIKPRLPTSTAGCDIGNCPWIFNGPGPSSLSDDLESLSKENNWRGVWLLSEVNG